ncbi:MAG: nucleotide excision repair endonuclease [Gracilimonas sp.]|uniref:nucleotide excision repair endonuclease n=1 Tax=Gracilimonas TaxID=649462 RepID=UPI001B08C8C3|nr:nucleotide excision repair endonuclease [Gracilimonas sp.]MBO6584886.1 nucleotide excision repair endonuclease [Gracilimonas sp.]MBO6615843.1 nucleotide excision repair endonuclease [Gracilimonas sp.]
MTLDLFEPTAITQKERVNKAMGGELPPHEPGVYTMYDKHDQVLYVGKGKDLQQRITSYRYSKSKKVQRMIAHLERISYEVCNTETDAILLENLLIRSLRPPFNHANKKPETYYYISTARRGNKKEFRLSMRVLDDYPEVYGCFKGHLKTRKGLGALLKLLFVQETSITSAHYLPSQLLNRITPQKFQLRLDEKSGFLVDQFLKGSSSLLADQLEEHILSLNFKDRFTENYFDNELELLRMFFTLGPQRNYRMKNELGLRSALINQDEIDDLLALMNEG